MSTQKLFAASVILFLFSVFILLTAPSAQAASSEVKLDANDVIVLHS